MTPYGLPVAFFVSSNSSIALGAIDSLLAIAEQQIAGFSGNFEVGGGG
jgi:hypothetical protein